MRISAERRHCDRNVTVVRELSSVVLRELFPLPLALGVAAERGPTVRLTAEPRTVRLRRVLPTEPSRREWLLEVEVEVPAVDPEQELLVSEGFLVDGSNGRAIGVVEQVEALGDPPAVASLILRAGWFGRRRLRVGADAVEALIPGERRLIIDESSLTPTRSDDA